MCVCVFGNVNGDIGVDSGLCAVRGQLTALREGSLTFASVNMGFWQLLSDCEFCRPPHHASASHGMRHEKTRFFHAALPIDAAAAAMHGSHAVCNRASCDSVVNIMSSS